MQESEAAHYKDAERIEGTLDVRKPLGSAGDFRRSLPTS
jgi:hypothetical protein